MQDAFLTLVFENVAFLQYGARGIPTLLITWPLSLLWLPMGIALESLLVKRWLGLSWCTTLRQMTKANLVSLVLGVPLGWFLALVVVAALAVVAGVSGLGTYPPTSSSELLSTILTAPWIGASFRSSPWVFPLAVIFILFPMFLSSAFLESRIASFATTNSNPDVVRRMIRHACAANHFVMFLVCSAWFALSWTESGMH